MFIVENLQRKDVHLLEEVQKYVYGSGTSQPLLVNCRSAV